MASSDCLPETCHSAGLRARRDPKSLDLAFVRMISAVPRFDAGSCLEWGMPMLKVNRFRKRCSQKASASSQRRKCLIERLEPRQMLAADWQNPIVLLDVSGDGLVSPLDALLGVNEINSPQIIDPITRALPERDEAEPPFFDTNPDGLLSPLDILLIINALNGDIDPPTLSRSCTMIQRKVE